MVRNFSLYKGDGACKVIYLAPIKTLCNERYEDWKARFGPLGTEPFLCHANFTGISCTELTGDTEFGNAETVRSLLSQDIIFTTPEKWDSITRKWREISFFLKEVGLIVLDEVHMLGESRGATLEAVISRMKMLNEDRVVANSRTIRFD